jgi:chlorobactene glucosyltransferase
MQPVQTSFILFLSTALCLAGLFITWWVHSRTQLDRVVEPVLSPLQENSPLVSVIVPARNEARNIQRCLTALLEQAYPRFELIVVDDRSTDETPRLLADLVRQVSPGSDIRLQVLSGTELPADWAGKPHALFQGVAAARGDWLCFVDADTFARPQLLASALAAAEQWQADLLTLLTDQDLGTFWEKVILPLVFTALAFGFPADRVNNPGKTDAIANGQFILIRSKVYQAVGGHQAVRARIDEDRALAELVKRSGYRLVVADGRQLVHTRMYTSLPEIWEGWTKNIFLGLRDRLWLLLLGAVIGLLGALALPFWLILGIGWLALGGGWAALLVTGQSLLVWSYLLIQRARAARAMNISPWYAVTLPLGALLFTAMMFTSAFKVISGVGVSWKGRTYR